MFILYCVANLFRTLYSIFYQKQPRFTEDITTGLRFGLLGHGIGILKEHDFLSFTSVETQFRRSEKHYNIRGYKYHQGYEYQ